jgi:hypothetical protein
MMKVVVAGKLIRSDVQEPGWLVPAPPIAHLAVSVHAMCLIDAPFTCWTREHPSGVPDMDLALRLRVER